MGKLIWSFLLSILALPALACPIEPAYRIAQEPKEFIEKADAVFFGKLVKLEDLAESEQVAEFAVEKTIKGALPNTVIVINKIHTSCSRIFQVKGSKYYVFAAKTNDKQVLLIDGYATFVPESVAMEKGVIFETAYNK